MGFFFIIAWTHPIRVSQTTEKNIRSIIAIIQYCVIIQGYVVLVKLR